VTLPAKLRSRTAVMPVLATVDAGIGLGVGLAPVGADSPRTGPYVALGDSYAAGPLVPDQTVSAGASQCRRYAQRAGACRVG
jgi:hypothetical protein